MNMDILYLVGNTGPIILLIVTIYLLWNNIKNDFKNTIIFYLMIGFFLNIVLNFILKEWIKEPRPIQKYLDNAYQMVPFNNYGMPSGHLQSCMYVFVFLIYVFYVINIQPNSINTTLSLSESISISSVYVIGFLMMICIITGYQRIIHQYHTIKQVIIGGIIGIMVGIIVGNVVINKVENNVVLIKS